MSKISRISSVRTINGKATVTVDTEQSHEVIDVQNGACLVMVTGGSDTEPAPTSRKATFAQTLGEMNDILASRGFKKIQEGFTTVYAYLQKAWQLADAEWNAKDSWLFSGDTYPDITPWHGVNTQYEDEAYNSFHAWLMAMQLSELAPTTGTTTNTQTDFFTLAYSYGGGRAVPIYGLALHADPMVSRLAAGALYAPLRNSYTFADMDKMRDEIGGCVINASDWSGLNYKGGYGKMQACGFLVNSDAIIPAAPGPFADGCDNGRAKPWEQGQPVEQFDLAGGNYDWDVDTDCFTVEQFNMGAQTPLAIWNGYDNETRQRIINVCAVARATDNFFFGKKLIHFDGIKNGSRAGNYKDYPYYWFSETTAAGADTYEAAGPFADLHDKMFTGGGFGTKTDAMKWFDKVLDIADNSRYPTFHNQYGRRRPCSGAAIPSARSEVYGSPLNALYNVDIACIFADTQAERDKWAAEGGFVSEKPKSYPSGHAAMTMTVALMLGQMTGDKDRLRKYITAAYTVGVNRTIGRAHWNSDVIYGRLFATFALPIINAMRGMRDGYEQTQKVICGDPTPTYEGTVNATVTIKNESGKTVKHDGKVCFVTYGTDPRGTGYKGYFRFRGNCSGSDFTIANGQSKTYSVTFVADDDPKVGLGMPFAGANQRGKYKSNNCYYVGGSGMTCKDFQTSDSFREGGQYTMTIPTDTHEWTS